MPHMVFDKVEKRFGNVAAVEDFNIEVPDKEFLVLVGPSGCGKSTLLRMIAGLTPLSGGRLSFNGQVVNGLSPKERDVAFVFQSYALYPHMTVRGNIAFPLVMEKKRFVHTVPLLGKYLRRRMARSGSIAEKVERIAELMGITDHLEKRPGALSGGQRQRVAVARALVRDPSLYLLDEPLSNLDAKLRSQMRSEIIALHRRTGKSFVYVTHDQVEAMTMGTMIVVLNHGKVQQVGTPAEVYDTPANTFVAQFLGSPAMNLFRCAFVDGELRLLGDTQPGLPTKGLEVTSSEAPPVLGVRPERVTLSRLGSQDEPVESLPESDAIALRARVVGIERLGSESIVGFVVAEGPDQGVPEDLDVLTVRGDAGGRGRVHYARTSSEWGLELGSDCTVRLNLSGASWFSGSSGDRLGEVLVAG
jgi:multiple sugar transport system ATP-binding protein